jgi:hypothetical protein
VTEPSKTNDCHSLAERAAAMTVAIGVVLLVLIGFAASYATLRDLAVSAGRFSPWLAPVVPLSFDLGIVVLSLKVVLAAKHGRSAIWLRLLVAGLSAATVAANASAAPTLIGRLLHAIPPAMFVICFESVAGSARHDALRARGVNVAVPPVRPLLLLLAPLVTCQTWRRQVLEAQREAALNATTAIGRSSLPVSEPAAPRGESQRCPETGVPSRRAHVGGATGGKAAEARLGCAREALRANPDMTAANLAEVLRRRGHACSVRTAQRVKLQAVETLSLGEVETASEEAA